MSNGSIKSSPICQHKVMKSLSTHDDDDADNNDNNAAVSKSTDESFRVDTVEQRGPVEVARLAATSADGSHNENHKNNNNLVRAEEK